MRVRQGGSLTYAFTLDEVRSVRYFEWCCQLKRREGADRGRTGERPGLVCCVSPGFDESVGQALFPASWSIVCLLRRRLAVA